MPSCSWLPCQRSQSFSFPLVSWGWFLEASWMLLSAGSWTHRGCSYLPFELISSPLCTNFFVWKDFGINPASFKTVGYFSTVKPPLLYRATLCHRHYPPSAALPGCGAQPECWGAQGTPPHPGEERAKATTERGKHSRGSGAMVCGDRPAPIPGDMPPKTPRDTRPEPWLSHGTAPGDTGWASPVGQAWAETASLLCKELKMGFCCLLRFFFPFVSERRLQSLSVPGNML